MRQETNPSRTIQPRCGYPVSLGPGMHVTKAIQCKSTSPRANHLCPATHVNTRRWTRPLAALLLDHGPHVRQSKGDKTAHHLYPLPPQSAIARTRGRLTGKRIHPGSLQRCESHLTGNALFASPRTAHGFCQPPQDPLALGDPTRLSSETVSSISPPILRRPAPQAPTARPRSSNCFLVA